MLKEKIKGLNALKKTVSGLKRRGKQIVFTNGCFDLLHLGHARYLEDAKKKGDILIVAVNSDSSVRKIKGSKRPIVSEKDRMGLVAALESVDFVAKFNEPTPIKVIKILKPDILIKGADWDTEKIVGADIVKLSGGRVIRINLLKGRSTSGIINKIIKNPNLKSCARKNF